MHKNLPFLMAESSAYKWIQFQEALLYAQNTVKAYAYGINDWLAFCHHNSFNVPSVGQDTVALYIRSLHSDYQLSASTIRQRLTIVRLYYDWQCEEGLCNKNPVRRGTWQNGGKGRRGIVPVHYKLPWIPDEVDWIHFLSIAAKTDIRTRFMLALAYNCALRREELCTIATEDIDPARRLITIRAENTKNRCARVIPYSKVTSELYSAWLSRRRNLSSSRGPLFLSYSPRNRAEPISSWTWSKVVRKLALEAKQPSISTHTFRHLALTELAQAGWDIHEIATFAGHRRVQSTLLYIHLSARDLSYKFDRTIASLHVSRLEVLHIGSHDDDEK